MTIANQLQELLEERTKSLKEATSRFNTLFENSPVSIQINDKEGRVTLVNSSWKRLWDVSDEFVENYIYKEYKIFEDKLLHEKGVIPYLQRAWAGETLEATSILYDPAASGKKGRRRITRPLLFPLKDSSGQVREVILIHEDITEQHELVEKQKFISGVAALLLETIEYSKTLEHLASATIPYLADGCLIDLIEDGEIKRLVTKHIDKDVEKILKELEIKFPPKLDSSQPTSRVIRSGHAELLEKVDLNVIKNHTYSKEHADCIRSTGLKSHLAVPLKIRGETIGAVNLLINSDRCPFNKKDLQLAEDVSRYASLAIVNARLYRDAQMAIAQREDFISNASHELKTPMTAMMLQMEIIQSLLKEKGALNKETLERVSSGATRQLNRLNSLIEDMLDLTRISNSKLIYELMKSVDLKSLVLHVLARFSDQLEVQNIEVSFEAIKTPFVNCDPGRMEQVLTNIISNALLYGEQLPIKIKLTSTEGQAILTIQDYGIGIATEHHERIFQRFERGFPATNGKGLGLGLFISKQIMEEQNGSISLKSELGKGTTFILKLPLS